MKEMKKTNREMKKTNREMKNDRQIKPGITQRDKKDKIKERKKFDELRRKLSWRFIIVKKKSFLFALFCNSRIFTSFI